MAYDYKTTIRLSAKMDERLKKWCYQSGRTKAQLIRACVEHCLNLKKIY